MSTKSNTSRKQTFSKKPTNHWSEGLLRAMNNPEEIVCEDDLTVTIINLYPKATFHYLVCPKEDIPTIKAVTHKHLEILKHMHKVGLKLSEKHKEKNFLLGYHSVPSMVRLHLHVISDDFDSPFLKTKKHWNSFTTPFFLTSEKVITELETEGKLSHKSVGEAKSFIKLPLKCHKCIYKPEHMPDLKHHLKVHIS